MNRTLLGLMISAAIGGYNASLSAAEAFPQQCEPNQDGEKIACLHPAWRDQAAVADDSDVRVKSAQLIPNVERQHPLAQYTLWALPSRVKQTNNKQAQETDVSIFDVDNSKLRLDSAKTDLNGSASESLDALITLLKGKAGLRIAVEGHADNQSLSARTQRIYKDNQALSIARAGVVADYLQKQLGLADTAITISGKGATEPLANNGTAAGMAQNRRVELSVWYQADSGPVTQERRIVCSDNSSVGQSSKGIKLTLDGQPVGQSKADGEDQQRCTDVALATADIRLQYDNLAEQPSLQVSAWQASAKAGERVVFRGYSNYLAWVKKAEVRVFSANHSVHAEPLAVIQLDDGLRGEWVLPNNRPRDMQYLLRVYDQEGRYDQTSALPLQRIAEHQPLEDEQLSTTQIEQIAYGKSHLAQQTIPLSGATVTVHGQNVPADHRVFWLGQPVPVDAKGRFVARQIIPRGQHTLEVAVLDAQGNGQLYHRDVGLKSDDWFHVGIIDVTAGHYRTNGAAYATSGDYHLDGSSFVDGRLAFYSKGLWRNKYKVTASADSGEEPLNELLSSMKNKDPRSLLRRLDDTAYYPVYGDDSVLQEDAPSQGKFYAKIEDERSHAMWGNFKIAQQETELAQINRGLYGAVIDWNSSAFTSDSQSQTEINLFAAEPGTQAARNEFRGTGGSLYYLEHQDIVTGSERVQVIVRDKDSGIVLSANTLVAGQDYDEDAVQGRIILNSPLPSTADDSQLVRAGSYAGHPVSLLVDYEYIGTMTDFDDLTVGGRASHWVNDSVRLGLTASREERMQEDQDLYGLDLLFRKTAGTYMRLETARTQGPGVSNHSSIDGGFNFAPYPTTVTNVTQANAYLIESGFQFSDLDAGFDGEGSFYIRHRDKYFSAPGQQVDYTTDQAGLRLSFPVTEQDKINLKVDLQRQKDAVDKEVVNLDWQHQIDREWSVTAGVRVDKRTDHGGLGGDNNNGDRTDLALQLDYAEELDWGLYGFTQATLEHNGNRDENNRTGLGGHYKLNDRLELSGELSDGSGGLGALVGSQYRLSERTTTYLNYGLDPDKSDLGIGNRQGKLVSGARHRYSDWVSIYGEEQYLHGDGSAGLVHAYGVDLTPDERWAVGLALESGRIESAAQTIERHAGSVTANYRTDDYKYGGSLELRHDESDTEHRDSVLTRNHLSYQVDPDWRLRLQLDLAFSDSDKGDMADADFIEAIVGYAYRPVENDRWNGLFEYKYLADQAPADQFTANEQQNEFQQRSHVLAVDAIYDLTERWTVGGKYAIRIGEIRAGRGEGDWFSSTAQLGIARLDWHVVKHWDALLEARVLDVREAEDTRSGALVGIYRHFGDHVKAGVGYNFTDFSDDLTDLNYDSKGYFINVIGKW